MNNELRGHCTDEHIVPGSCPNGEAENRRTSVDIKTSQPLWKGVSQSHGIMAHLNRKLHLQQTQQKKRLNGINKFHVQATPMVSNASQGTSNHSPQATYALFEFMRFHDSFLFPFAVSDAFYFNQSNACVIEDTLQPQQTQDEVWQLWQPQLHPQPRSQLQRQQQKKQQQQQKRQQGQQGQSAEQQSQQPIMGNFSGAPAPPSVRHQRVRKKTGIQKLDKSNTMLGFSSMSQASTAATEQAPSRAERNMFHKTKMCKYFAIGACIQGSKCMYAHSTEDQKPKPDLFCTKLCPLFKETGACGKEGCTYAHHAAEVRQTKHRPAPEEQSEGSLSEKCRDHMTFLCEGLDDIFIVKNSFLHVVTQHPVRLRSHSAPAYYGSSHEGHQTK